ncbi:pyridoxal phosphate-dependent aminotransferase [Nonomuraea sp. SMC257]|uniref:Pyridoxal phosphate-dependent aminotransferase n=1 Tax=Nonomuraea montanisoli TaxID=2741721 RepID=A0A7Y6IFJ0_9ACTN|nr:pyridoxal phosphate-dependent aminotransferase [Nonomuraea montanisoli]NUW37161.1 pyridoxal phosphate-dependent aminotransferase [Nonomuraea montanisoli]
MEAPEAAGAKIYFASRTNNLSSGGIGAWIRLVRSRGAVDLAVGNPEYPETPVAMISAVCAAIKSGCNQYEDPFGAKAARVALARTFGRNADPETELTITCGATEGLTAALLALVEPGDEVVTFEPLYQNHLDAIRLAGGQARLVRLRPPRWRYDPAELRRAFGARSRVFLLNTPHNPTGRVFEAAEIAEIAELCLRWNTVMVSDEVYADFVFGDRRHVSVADVAELAPRAVVVGSLSKSHAVSGWRQGFLWARAATTQVLRQVHVALTGGAAAPLQQAFVQLDACGHAGGNGGVGMEERLGRAMAIFQGRGLECIAPEGGCYFMVDAGDAGQDSCSYADWLLENRRVAVAPGSLFYASPADGLDYFRVAFNKSDETLWRAQARMSDSGRGSAPTDDRTCK